MRVEVEPDPAPVARRGAFLISLAAADAVRARGRFLFATSAGRTPWRMLTTLANLPMPWAEAHLFQVDERVVPHGDPSRNLSQLAAAMLGHVPLPSAQLHAMPVEMVDLSAAAAAYSALLRRIAGDPPRLDLVHLGLGADGHTASLFPGDPTSAVPGADVVATRAHDGHCRLSLGWRVLGEARTLLWVVTGAEKADSVRRLVQRDRELAASRLVSARAVLLVDEAAARSI